MHKAEHHNEYGKKEVLSPGEASSGSLGSPLGKVLQKETKIGPERKWAKEFIEQIPYDQLEIVTEFLKRVPPEKAEEAARKLFEVIRGISNGVLGSHDPKATLEYCIEQVEKRIEERKKVN